MHTPTKWKMESTNKMHKFINEFGFASIISHDLNASHIPLFLESGEGEFGVLYGHFAKSNPHWETVVGTSVLVIFSGPHSYISPTWYAAQPAVPTWNYSAVHAYGTLELIDNDKTVNVLEQTVNKYEPKMLSIPDEYKIKMLNGIVGFKITITEIQGKDKLGQHRNRNDQLGVVAALSESENPEAKELLKYMQKNSIGIGN